MARNIKHSGAVTVNVGAGQQQQQQQQQQGQQQGQPGQEPIYGPVTIDQSVRYHRWPWWGILIAVILLAAAIFLSSLFAYRAGKEKIEETTTVIVETPKSGGGSAVDSKARQMAKDAQEGVEKNREKIFDIQLEQHKMQLELEYQKKAAEEASSKSSCDQNLADWLTF